MKGHFLTRLNLQEYLVGGASVAGEWVVLTALVYLSAAGVSFCVPRGFITDLASIPKLFRNIIDVNGEHRRAAVLHDYLYCVQTVSRAEADALFKEAMEVLGVPAWKRHVMWSAVRAGGWVYWNKRAKLADTSGDFVPDSYFSEA